MSLPSSLTFLMPRPLFATESADVVWALAITAIARDYGWPCWSMWTRALRSSCDTLCVLVGPQDKALVEADCAKIEAALAEVLKAEGSST